jgi:O-antigen polymerase
VAYLLLYRLTGPDSESYYWSYLLVSFAAFYLVYLLLRLQAVSASTLYLPILLTGVVEAFVVLLQWVHFIPSHSPFFPVTGTGTNPNLSAMVLCMAVPAAVEWPAATRGSVLFLKIALLVVLLTAILLTHCRSALLALLAISLLYLPSLLRALKLAGIKSTQLSRAGAAGAGGESFDSSSHAGRSSRLPMRIARGALVVLPLLLVLTFFVVNRQKEASSNGRLTIWHLTGELIARRPFLGYGYGYFEKAYNLHQAAYFNQAPRPEQERMNASFTGMAYNEYLEQMVMGGVLGGVLFTAFLASLLYRGWRYRSRLRGPLAGVLVFSLMSLFNFTVAYPVLLLFLLLYAARIADAEISTAAAVDPDSESATRPAFAGASPLKGSEKRSKIHSSTILRSVFFWFDTGKPRAVFLAACLVTLLLSLPKYRAQQDLTRAASLLKSGHLHQAGELLSAIEPQIASSEAYYTTRAQYHLAQRDYPSARADLLQVLRYTSSPYPMQDLASVSATLGKMEEAEHYLLTTCGIEPHLLRPRVLLMELYHHTGQYEKARVRAREILALKPKVDTPQVERYRKRAAAVLSFRQAEPPAPASRAPA